MKELAVVGVSADGVLMIGSIRCCLDCVHVETTGAELATDCGEIIERIVSRASPSCDHPVRPRPFNAIY